MKRSVIVVIGVLIVVLVLLLSYSASGEVVREEVKGFFDKLFGGEDDSVNSVEAVGEVSITILPGEDVEDLREQERD
jgi:hypothetical protein